MCLRILVLASDLLDLVGASTQSFLDIGGVSGLVAIGVFSNSRQVYEILSFLDQHVLPDETCDGFYEALHDQGLTEDHLTAMIDFGLVEYSVQSVDEPDSDVQNIGMFALT